MRIDETITAIGRAAAAAAIAGAVELVDAAAVIRPGFVDGLPLKHR
jgi:hypothetical protein